MHCTLETHIVTCIPEVWHRPSIQEQVSVVSSELQSQLTNDQSWQWRKCHYFTVQSHAMHSSARSESTQKACAFIRVCTLSVDLDNGPEDLVRTILLAPDRKANAGRDSSFGQCNVAPLGVHVHLILKGTVIFSYDSIVPLQNILSHSTGMTNKWVGREWFYQWYIQSKW